jgi:hypothetical protein
MTSKRRILLLAGLILAACAASLPLASTAARLTAQALPARLTDQQFWRLSAESSEPNGYFRSDNLVSNETGFQAVVPDLIKRTTPGRVYMGVGPEQNFTYIVATKPQMAFIVDVRRGNLELQLMYKALFELSADRAEFISRLFAKKRPDALPRTSTAAELFAAFWNVETSDASYNANLQAIDDVLVRKHRLPLSPDDLHGIEYIYHSFYWYGPRITYSSTGSFGGATQPDYAELMAATDIQARSRSYLATDENFAFMKDLESRNMLVPVVGNFGGTKAIRAIGQYLRDNGATVSAFYVSNVEQYLRQDMIWDTFCDNVASLPLDASSTFIRSAHRSDNVTPFGLSSELGSMLDDTSGCR